MDASLDGVDRQRLSDRWDRIRAFERIEDRSAPFGIARLLGGLAFVVAAGAVACTSSTLSSTGPSPTKCQVSVNKTADSIGAAGGTATVSLTAEPECAWKAAADVNWIAEVKPASGQGSANVEIRIVANDDPVPRQGTVQITGTEVRITQEAAACVFDVSPGTRSLAAAGGSMTVSVATKSGCGWSATTDVSWITFGSAASGSGNGVVTASVAINSGEARVGTITIAGQTVTVTQAAATVTCSFTLSSTNQTVADTAGSGAPIALTTAPTCSWTAISGTPWITVTNGASGSGNGSVSFAVAANTGAQRTGTLAIADQTYTVTQSAALTPTPTPTPCSYALVPGSQSISDSGGSGFTVLVTTILPTCAWTASSNDSWISVTSGSSGSGNGTVTFSAAANPGAARSGTMTIAGQTFTVSQAAVVCTYQINPTSQSFAKAGGSGTPVSVTAPASCSWTASSNDPWITVVSGASGSGNGTVTFTVDVNGNRDRTGTMTIATQTFTVDQSRR